MKRINVRAAGAALYVAAFGVVSLYSGGAAAWSPTANVAKRGHREPFCAFFSGPSCTNTLLFDLFLEYQRDINSGPWNKNRLRLGGELGYLLRLGSTDTQLGVIAEGGGFVNDDVKSWYVVPKLRARWWPRQGPTGVEFSGGAIYTGGYFVTAGPDVRRWGAQAEVGMTIYGAFTIVTGGDWLRAPDGTSSGTFFIGARTTLLTFPWGILSALK